MQRLSVRYFASKAKFRPRKVSKNDQLKSDQTTEMLYGVYPVLTALDSNQRSVHRILYNEASKRVEDIVEKATQKGIKTEAVQPQILDKMARNSTKEMSVHQGVCAEVSKLERTTLEPPFANIPSVESEHNLWILLTSIGDPQNLGAIIRSSYFLGARGILTCDGEYEAKVRKKTSALTPVVSKASSGVLEIFQPVHLSDPEGFLRLKRSQNWNIIGSCSGDQQASEPPSIKDTNSLLIIGNEGYGVPDSFKPYCSHFVTLAAGRSLHPNVDSLNVSVATALLIQSLTNPCSKHISK